MQKTYDVVRGDEKSLIYIRLTQYDEPTSRIDLFRALADFDESVLDISRMFSQNWHIELSATKWSGPQFMAVDNQIRQLMYYEPIYLDNEMWAGVQGALDQNGWEAW